MGLKEIEIAWNELVDCILQDWPEMSADYLSNIAGDKTAFAAYVAQTYHLTLTEACEMIDEWVWSFRQAQANLKSEVA